MEKISTDGPVESLIRRVIFVCAMELFVVGAMSQYASAHIIGRQLPTSTLITSGVPNMDSSDLSTYEGVIGDPGITFTVPADGTINAFNLQVGTNYTGGARQVIHFLVLRPTGIVNQFIVAARAGPYAASAGVNRYPQTISVQSGDVIGISLKKETAPTYAFDGLIAGNGQSFLYITGDTVSPGDVSTFQQYFSYRLPLNAEFEPTSTVGNPTPTPDASPPSISDISRSKRCVYRKSKRKARHGKKRSNVAKKRYSGRCGSKSTVTFRLDKPGEVRLTAYRLLGRRFGYRPKKDRKAVCKKLSRKQRKKLRGSKRYSRRFYKKNKRCRARANYASKALSGVTGTNKYIFKGKIGKLKLSPSVYTLELKPVGSESKVKTRIRVKLVRARATRK